MDEAIAAVHTHPAYAPFQAYRLANPQSRLIGVYAYCDDPEYWAFTYGIPAQGTAYIVSHGMEGPPDSLPNGVMFDGPNHFTPFSPDELEVDLLSLAAADVLWSAALEGEPNDSGLTIVRWGVITHLQGRPAENPPMGFGVLSFSATPSRADASSTPTTWLGINLVEGRVATMYEREFAYALDPIEAFEALVARAEALLAPPPSLGPSAPPETAPPVVSYVGGATVSLLAVIIAAVVVLLVKHGWAGLAGFAKIRPENLLKHPLRDQMMQLVASEPGIEPPMIARRLGTAWSTTMHHLRTLEKNGYIRSVVDGRHKRCFAADAVPHGVRPALAVLRNPNTERVWQMVQSRPGIGRAEVARALGVTPPAAGWHLERLEGVGLVQRSAEGRRVRFEATAVGASSAGPR